MIDLLLYHPEDSLGAILREMFVFGSETQATLLRWAIRILSIHKDVQRQIQDEIDEHVERNADVVWEDRHKYKIEFRYLVQR